MTSSRQTKSESRSETPAHEHHAGEREEQQRVELAVPAVHAARVRHGEQHQQQAARRRERTRVDREGVHGPGRHASAFLDQLEGGAGGAVHPGLHEQAQGARQAREGGEGGGASAAVRRQEQLRDDHGEGRAQHEHLGEQQVEVERHGSAGLGLGGRGGHGRHRGRGRRRHAGLGGARTDRLQALHQRPGALLDHLQHGAGPEAEEQQHARPAG